MPKRLDLRRNVVQRRQGVRLKRGLDVHTFCRVKQNAPGPNFLFRRNERLPDCGSTAAKSSWPRRRETSENRAAHRSIRHLPSRLTDIRLAGRCRA